MLYYVIFLHTCLFRDCCFPDTKKYTFNGNIIAKCNSLRLLFMLLCCYCEAISFN